MIEEIDCSGTYKLGDNITQSRKVSICRVPPLSLPQIIHLPGSGHCPLVRNSEPIRLPELPTSPSLHVLIEFILFQTSHTYNALDIFIVDRLFNKETSYKKMEQSYQRAAFHTLPVIWKTVKWLLKHSTCTDRWNTIFLFNKDMS